MDQNNQNQDEEGNYTISLKVPLLDHERQQQQDQIQQQQQTPQKNVNIQNSQQSELESEIEKKKEYKPSKSILKNPYTSNDSIEYKHQQQQLQIPSNKPRSQTAQMGFGLKKQAQSHNNINDKPSQRKELKFNNNLLGIHDSSHNIHNSIIENYEKIHHVKINANNALARSIHMDFDDQQQLQGGGDSGLSGARKNRIQSDVCDDFLQARKNFFKNQFLISPDKSNRKESQIQSRQQFEKLQVQIDKSQYLTSEYQLTFQQKWEWPAKLEVAKDHEMATSIGVEKRIKLKNGKEVIDYEGCKCCLQNVNKEPCKWWSADIDSSLPYKAGTAIPIYFHLIKYYAFFMILVFLVNGIYIVHETYKICEFNVQQKNLCYSLGVLQFSSREYIRFILWIQKQEYDVGKPGEYDLQIFTWLNFAAFFIIMISQLFVDVYISHLEKKMGKQPTRQCLRTVLIKNIPDHEFVMRDGKMEKVPLENDEQRRNFVLKYLKQKAKDQGMENDYKIKSIFLIQDYSKFNEFFQKRTNMYYQLKPILKNKSINKDIEIIKMKAYIYFWNLYLQQEVTQFGGKAIVTFMNSLQAYQAREDIMPYKAGKSLKMKFVRGINKVFKNKRLDNYIDQANMMHAEPIPEPYEILWQNFGLRSEQKTQNYNYINIATVIVILIFGVLIIFIVQTLKSGVYYFFAFLFTIIIHGLVMQIVTLKRKGKTYSSNAFFLLSRVTPFQLLFIIIMPFIFYLVSNVPLDTQWPGVFQKYKQQLEQDQLKSKKVLFLFAQVCVFSILSLLFSWLDLPARIHRNRKKKIEKKKMENQFCQSNLNEAFEKPEFMIELHLLQIVKIWSFAALHSFLCPLSIIVLLFLLLFQLYYSRYHLFSAYTVKTFKNNFFLRKYLWQYGHYFQLVVLVVYLLLLDREDKTEKLTFWLAIGTYFICIIVNVIRYFQYRKHWYKKRLQDAKQSVIESQISNSNVDQTKENEEFNLIEDKEVEIDLHESLNLSEKIQDSNIMMGDEESCLSSWDRTELTQRHQGEQSYQRYYNLFKRKFFCPTLEEEIQEVLGLKEDYNETSLQEDRLKTIQQDEEEEYERQNTISSDSPQKKQGQKRFKDSLFKNSKISEGGSSSQQSQQQQQQDKDSQIVV